MIMLLRIGNFLPTYLLELSTMRRPAGIVICLVAVSLLSYVQVIGRRKLALFIRALAAGKMLLMRANTAHELI